MKVLKTTLSFILCTSLGLLFVVLFFCFMWLPVEFSYKDASFVTCGSDMTSFLVQVFIKWGALFHVPKIFLPPPTSLFCQSEVRHCIIRDHIYFRKHCAMWHRFFGGVVFLHVIWRALCACMSHHQRIFFIIEVTFVDVMWEDTLKNLGFNENSKLGIMLLQCEPSLRWPTLFWFVYLTVLYCPQWPRRAHQK